MASTEFSGVDLVAVTGVHYTNQEDIRFALALETAENMATAGIPYVVVDSSPEGHKWVADAHRLRSAYVVRATIGGIATQRQQGVALAVNQGANRVLSAEPEKTRMPEFAKEIVDGLSRHDILVIGRTPAAEASLPPVQCQTEHLAGWILQNTLELQHDTLSGGRGFTASGAETLADYPATQPGMNNWIYLYSTLLTAQANSLSVGGIDVDLLHPQEMYDDETGNPVFDQKRLDQFSLQLNYLMARPEITPTGQDIASIVRQDLEGFGSAVPTEIGLSRLAALSNKLTDFGYRPPVNL